jgi:hypothetical protein
MNKKLKFKIISRLLTAAFLVFGLQGICVNQSGSMDPSGAQGIPGPADSIRQPRCQPIFFPTVTAVGSLAKTRPAHLAVYGDYIFVKVDSIPDMVALADSIAGQGNDTMGEVILYINGNAMRDIALLNINGETKELIFHLDKHSPYLMKFYPQFKYMWSELPVKITAGFKNGMMFRVNDKMEPLRIKYVTSWALMLSLLFGITIIGVFIVLAAKTNLIRIGNSQSPFSLALTQLSFWSIVVASSFIYIWIVTEQIPDIVGSTLILISISAFTTAGSRLVDIRGEGRNAVTAHSDNFMSDILQDEQGYSVHRAQMFMWTIIMGIVFVTSVIRLQQFPEISDSLLGLMGISSGTYVGLKTMENKKKTEPGAGEEKGDGEANPV